MINTIRAMIARAAVRLAIAAAPAEQAERLRQVTRPIWRPQ